MHAGVAAAELPSSADGVTGCLEKAYATMAKKSAPYALLVRKVRTPAHTHSSLARAQPPCFPLRKFRACYRGARS